MPRNQALAFHSRRDRRFKMRSDVLSKSCGSDKMKNRSAMAREPSNFSTFNRGPTSGSLADERQLGKRIQLRRHLQGHELPCSDGRLGIQQSLFSQPDLSERCGHQERQDPLLRSSGVRVVGDRGWPGGLAPSLEPPQDRLSSYSSGSARSAPENSGPAAQWSTLLSGC